MSHGDESWEWVIPNDDCIQIWQKLQCNRIEHSKNLAIENVFGKQKLC